MFAILRHAEDFPWRINDIGLMGLRLDEGHDHRLHVWDPTVATAEPPIHDHPYDFTSTVVAGELTNTRFLDDPAGDEYVRFRYVPPAEDQRHADRVRLSAVSEVLRAGDDYRQFADELHASGQEPGTVTVMRCSWRSPGPLTVCVRDESLWSSGQARDATRDEITSFAAKALAWF